MSPEDVPVVGALSEGGPDDRVFDALVLAGPVVVLALTTFGREAATTALAAAYLLAFLGYVCLRGVRRTTGSDST
ncbi:MAG: hypothetical protein ABEJ80_00495 [Halarchaeum sp.]